MAATIPVQILGLRGQCVKSIDWEADTESLLLHCERDRRFAPVANPGGGRCTVNQRLRRRIRDLPLWGRATVLDIEYCQVKVGARDRRVEWLSFVAAGAGFTRRFARFVNQLCRHMPINAVANYTGLAWRTVKRMDQCALEHELPALDPGALTHLRHLGVDEVARAKGHDYVTIVYDLDSGDLVWVTEGRSKAGLVEFFDRLDDDVAQGIQAVAMDMAGPFSAAVQESLPNAAIVYDRFHVMQMYSKTIDQVRRSEFKKASKEDKDVLKGSRYLLLKNSDKLSEKQAANLVELLAVNAPLNAVYALKEQLQLLWDSPTNFAVMAQRLDDWCAMAEATGLAPMKRFVNTLRNHRTGVCNYAEHRITTARLESGNVAVGMIRKRARGLLDLEYFKLKIRQSAVPEKPFGLYDLR